MTKNDMNGRDDTRAHWRARRLRLLTVFLTVYTPLSGKFSAARGMKIDHSTGRRVLSSLALSGSSVVPMLRGKALASVRSMSQISIGASAERAGGFFWTRGDREKSGRKKRTECGDPGVSQISKKFMQDAPRLETDISGRQGIFTNPHSKLAIHAG